MKKAFINTILLGFILIASAIVLIATLNDDIVVQNKVANIKSITSNAALAAAKHYLINKDTFEAEDIALNIIKGTSLGAQISDGLSFLWQFEDEPNFVNVSVNEYLQETFWYKFLGKDNFIIPIISSQADIIFGKVFKESSETLAPLAINNCNRDDLLLDSILDFTFVISPYYDNTNNDGFFGVDQDCSFPAGNSNFAHFKNLFSQGEIDYSQAELLEMEQGCLVDTSFQNPLSVDPMQLYNNLKKFELPIEMDILTFDCGTTSDNLIISDIMSIRITALPPLISGPKLDGKNTKILTIQTTIGEKSNVMLNY